MIHSGAFRAEKRFISISQDTKAIICRIQEEVVSAEEGQRLSASLLSRMNILKLFSLFVFVQPTKPLHSYLEENKITEPKRSSCP
jgi:hypothetical protein